MFSFSLCSCQNEVFTQLEQANGFSSSFQSFLVSFAIHKSNKSGEYSLWIYPCVTETEGIPLYGPMLFLFIHLFIWLSAPPLISWQPSEIFGVNYPLNKGVGTYEFSPSSSLLHSLLLGEVL